MNKHIPKFEIRIRNYAKHYIDDINSIKKGKQFIWKGNKFIYPKFFGSVEYRTKQEYINLYLARQNEEIQRKEKKRKPLIEAFLKCQSSNKKTIESVLDSNILGLYGKRPHDSSGHIELGIYFECHRIKKGYFCVFYHHDSANLDLPLKYTKAAFFDENFDRQFIIRSKRIKDNKFIIQKMNAYKKSTN